MKILLFGANGQVGWELRRSLAPLGELVALGSEGADGLAGDFLSPEAVAATVDRVRPGLVVNAAAYTAVDKAETDADRALAINALAPEAIARAARRVGAPVVHYSTDYVFDGSGSRPWREDDAPAPLNVYGRTKLEGERRIAAAQPLHLVLRTSWVYAARGANFASTMLRLARERDRLSVVDDQFGAPTGAELLADATAHAVRSLLRDPGLAGLYHVTAGGETTWHGYACFVVGKAQQAGEVFKAGPQQVLPVPSSAFPAPARRPHNSRLDSTRFRTTFGLTLPPWETGVARMLDELL